MHDDGIGARQRQPLGSQAELRKIPIRIRQIRLPHALLLDPQHHHHVNVLEPGRECRVTRASLELAFFRHQHGRGDDPKVSDTQGAKRVER